MKYVIELELCQSNYCVKRWEAFDESHNHPSRPETYLILEEAESGVFHMVETNMLFSDHESFIFEDEDEETYDLEIDDEVWRLVYGFKWEDVHVRYKGYQPPLEAQAPSIERLFEALQHVHINTFDWWNL